MATNKTSQKVNIPMLAACVLLCLTLLSLHLTAGLYARYTTSGQASDTARVAAFKVVDTPSVLEETVNFVASPGELVYTIHIDNQSETAIAYTFGVENVYGNLPLRFSVNNSTPTAGSASLSASRSRPRNAPCLRRRRGRSSRRGCPRTVFPELFRSPGLLLPGRRCTRR
jgi:hypothetical protein